MSLTWTSPTRRIGDHELPFLANEVYLCIFDHLQPSDNGLSERQHRRILWRLAHVCCFFYAVSLPRLLQSINFECPNSQAVVWPKTLEFCRELNFGRKPALSLASYIKKCSITSQVNATYVPRFPPYMAICAIPRFAYLESLFLSSVPIGSKFCQSLKTLKNLKVLSITKCKFDCTLPITGSVAFSLTSFELFSTALIQTGLHNFINPASLSVLKTDNWNFTEILFSQPVNFHITELSLILPAYGLSIVADFLNRTPSITTLRIPFLIFHNWSQVTFYKLPITPTSLPHLDKLQCPTYFLADLAPGRPVTHVDLYSVVIPIQFSEDIETITANQIADLKRSTAIITTLRVPSDAYSAIFNKPFLHLQKLIVVTSQMNATLTRFMWSLCCEPNIPPLQELTFEYGSSECEHYFPLRFHLSRQREIIAVQFTPFLPSLGRVSFTKDVYWEKHASEPDRWRPFIPMELHERVKNLIKGYNSDIIDFDGVVLSLYEADELSDEIRKKLLPIVGGGETI